MSLIKRDSYLPTWSNLFNDFLNRDWYDWSNQNFSLTNTTIPSVNIKESENGFEVEMAAPGMKKEDFNLEIHNNVLTISSEKQTENKTEDDKNVTRREFSYQSFSRSFTMPVIVDTDKISAAYKMEFSGLTSPKRRKRSQSL